ncbi:MAG: heparinase II/III family protein [Candidatus Cloacimonetes bacterium]|nr:heparinase II/III family protein [Candidatus Cloacimonadota bacterium]
MKRLRFVCLILFSLILTTSLLAQTGAWHPEKTYWPRTLIDSSDAAIDVVRDRITIEPYDTIYTKVVTSSDIPYYSCSMERDKAKVCRCAAFRYLMEDNITYADKAKEYLLVAQREYAASGDWIQKYKNILWDSEIISMICLAYDFLKGNAYDFGVDETAVRNQIKGVASSLYYDLIADPNPWAMLRLMWENGFGEEINYGVKFASAMGMAAIVLNTETSGNDWEQPQTWINYSMNKLHDQFHDYLVDEDGGWAEGAHYQRFSASNYIPFTISHCNFVDGQTEDYDGTPLPPLLLDLQFEKNAEWGIKIRMPNGARPNFDDSFLDPYFYNGYFAAYWDNDLYAWDYIVSASPYYSSASSGNMDVEMICAYDNYYTGTTAPDFSLTQFLPTSGQAVFRSSWDQDAVYMCLLGENGQARLGGRTHEHPDNTSFIISAYGELLAMDCGYISWDKRDSVRFAENHSLILVDGNGPPAAGASTSEGADAFIENFFDTDKFDYSEVSTNYQNTDFKRCVSFIDDSYFVISDFVDGSESHTYDWLLHGNGGGTTGNGFFQTTYGSVYSVNDVDLNFFINSTEDITLSNYDDYHDGGIYDSLFMHTVTKAGVSGEDVLFSSFLIPSQSSRDITYNPIDMGTCVGGTISMDNEKTITLVKNNNNTVSAEFFGINVSSDCHILVISRLDDDIPKNIFIKEGQSLSYDDTTIVNCSEITNLALNIFSDYADGYVSNGCEVEFYTGNEPTNVIGGTYSFSNGITTILFPDDTNFHIDVEWSFTYDVDEEPIEIDILDNLNIYPNPFKEVNTISFTIKKPQQISIEVFNLKGQKIITVIDSYLQVGDYTENWDGVDWNNNRVTSGTYFYRICINNSKFTTKKINLIR